MTTTAPITVQDLPFPLPPDAADPILALLSHHLPKSLHLLRRVQFAQHTPHGRTSTSHLLLARAPADAVFAAAYADLSKAPETLVYLYASSSSSSSGADDGAGDGTAAAADLVLALMRRLRGIAEREGRPPGVMFGSVDEGLRRAVLARDARLRTTYWNPHDKWVFRLADLPVGGSERVEAWMKEEALVWDAVRREDCGLVMSRTKIPKTENTLMTLPNMGVRLRDGALVAWAFKGVDGTLSTLHVEEPYRGKGLAKALAVRIMTEKNEAFSDDGWCSADVHIDNKESQGVCKSLGGYAGWRVSWTRFDLDTVSDAIQDEYS